MSIFGAGGRGRTDTVLPPRDFESRTSANSITPAYKVLNYNTILFLSMQEKFLKKCVLFTDIINNTLYMGYFLVSKSRYFNILPIVQAKQNIGTYTNDKNSEKIVKK